MLNQQDTADSADELVPLAYVTRRLGVSPNTVHRLERHGVLRALRFTESSHRRYRRAEVDALVATGSSS